MKIFIMSKVFFVTILENVQGVQQVVINGYNRKLIMLRNDSHIYKNEWETQCTNIISNLSFTQIMSDYRHITSLSVDNRVYRLDVYDDSISETPYRNIY